LRQLWKYIVKGLLQSVNITQLRFDHFNWKREESFSYFS